MGTSFLSHPGRPGGWRELLGLAPTSDPLRLVRTSDPLGLGTYFGSTGVWHQLLTGVGTNFGDQKAGANPN